MIFDDSINRTSDVLNRSDNVPSVAFTHSYLLVDEAKTRSSGSKLGIYSAKSVNKYTCVSYYVSITKIKLRAEA